MQQSQDSSNRHRRPAHPSFKTRPTAIVVRRCASSINRLPLHRQANHEPTSHLIRMAAALSRPPRRVCIQPQMQVRMHAWRIHLIAHHPRRNSPVLSAPVPWLVQPPPQARQAHRPSMSLPSANLSKSSKVSDHQHLATILL